MWKSVEKREPRALAHPLGKREREGEEETDWRLFVKNGSNPVGIC